MSSASEYAARGKVIEASAERVVFQPAGTTYELHLACPPDSYAGPLKQPIDALVRVQARKVYTVPSGGNFISPIFGPPKIIQGRVRHLDDRMLVVHAGCCVIVDLPGSDSAIDLGDGQITVGDMVNVVALPGATFQQVEESAVR